MGIQGTKDAVIPATGLWPVDFGFGIADATRLLRRTFNKRVEKFGVTGSQWRIIAYLMRRDGMTQVEIADELDCDKAAIGRTIERLEKRGLLIRKACDADGRARRVYLTALAREIGLKIKKVAEDTYTEALRPLNHDEQAQFMAALDAVRRQLEAMYNR